MAGNLSREIQRLIYDELKDDLKAIKALREVSKSWALGGVPALVLEKFTMLHYRRDIQRLRSISENPLLADEAKWKVKQLKFRDIQFDPELFQSMFIEDDAFPRPIRVLHELDRYIAYHEDAVYLWQQPRFLIDALEAFPNVDRITIFRRSPYLSAALTMAWNKYRPRLTTDPGRQVMEILSAAQQLSRAIRHLECDWFPALYFTMPGGPGEIRPPLYLEIQGAVASLTTLDLTIGEDNFLPWFFFRSLPRQWLRELIMAAPDLENLVLYFTKDFNLHFWPPTLLPINFMPTAMHNLHSISLHLLDLDVDNLFDFLGAQHPQLRRLSVSGVSLAMEAGSWTHCCASAQEALGPNLEKFQLMASMHDEGRVIIKLAPRYDTKNDWAVLDYTLEENRNNYYFPGPITLNEGGDNYPPELMDLAKRVESFVIRDTPFPPHADFMYLFERVKARERAVLKASLPPPPEVEVDLYNPFVLEVENEELDSYLIDPEFPALVGLHWAALIADIIAAARD